MPTKPSPRVVAVAGAVSVVAVSFLALLFFSRFSTLRPPRRLNAEDGSARLSSLYDDWHAVTQRFVDVRGHVDYAAMKRDPDRLNRFVALLAKVGPRTRPDVFNTRSRQLAYYINAYNALTLFNVLHRYPQLGSPHDIKEDFFYFTRFAVDGDELSLYSLENDIIRKRFADPRVHFALNCAGAGCPRLPREPFLPDQLDAQLRRETARFLAEPRNVESKADRVVLSEIFKWYAEDFLPTPLAWIRKHAPQLNLSSQARVEHRPYDWTLNDQR